MQVAYFSPLPPQRTGVADYSAELLPYLAEAGAELTLFVDTGYTPQLPPAADHIPIVNYRRFNRWRKRNPGAILLYHIGNNAHYHTYIYKILQHKPGIAVLHDYVLHNLFIGTTANRRKVREYIELMRSVYGAKGEEQAHDLLAGREVDLLAYPLVEYILDSSLGVITHSRYVQRLVRQRRPTLPVKNVNILNSVLPPALRPLPERRAVRAELGLTGRLVLASFGLVTPHKRFEVALRAFARLRTDFPNSIYLIVGETVPEYDIFDLVKTLDLGDSVVFTGRLDMTDFIQYMLAADIALNLRYPTSGETSATLIRLLGLGIPTLVSNLGAYADLPDDCCFKIDVDELEEKMILVILQRLANDKRLRIELGENARHYITKQCAPEQIASDYMVFLRAVVSGESADRIHDPSTQLVDQVGELLAGMDVVSDDPIDLRPLAVSIADLGIFGDTR